MANTVLRTILKEIQSASWFSIIADEATDVKRCEQMCICIRWVDDEYEVSEEPIGLVQVPKTVVSVPDPNQSPARIAFSITCGDGSGRYSAHS